MRGKFYNFLKKCDMIREDRETAKEEPMRKTMEQIVVEGQAAKCETLEELYLLWQMMQQMEEEPFGATCYEDIDPRSFHIDGIVSQKDFNGTLYILKEPSMRKIIQKGQTMPVISDMRCDLYTGKSPSGEAEYLEYLSGMQRILNGETEETKRKTPDPKLLRQTAVVYINKRGGKGAADEISMQYGQYYIEFLKRQIRLLNPKTIVCCGEEIFRLVIMEVFQNKRRKKNRETYMKWKDVVIDDVFLADSHFKHTNEEEKAAVKVIRMWSPAYRVNNGQYVSLEEYLKEFGKRVAAGPEPEKNS